MILFRDKKNKCSKFILLKVYKKQLLTPIPMLLLGDVVFVCYLCAKAISVPLIFVCY